MENQSAKMHNKTWISADSLIRAITEDGLDFEFSSGITGKYTAFIKAREEALKKEAEMRAQKLAAKAKQNSEEEEMVC